MEYSLAKGAECVLATAVCAHYIELLARHCASVLLLSMRMAPSCMILT